MVRPGEIRRAHYEQSDGRPPREPQRVLILAVGPVGSGEDHVVVVAKITSVEVRVQNPRLGDIRVDEQDCDGVDKPSVIRCRQFNSIPLARIGEKLGEVDISTLMAAQDEARNILCY